MAGLLRIHHVAIICSDYTASLRFYTQILGLELRRETYRPERKSYKADLYLNGEYVVELFSFPSPPLRLTKPEARGLRHLAFAVENIEEIILDLSQKGVETEPVRIDETTGKKFTFLRDPDQMPIELYEF